MEDANRNYNTRQAFVFVFSRMNSQSEKLGQRRKVKYGVGKGTCKTRLEKENVQNTIRKGERAKHELELKRYI